MPPQFQRYYERPAPDAMTRSEVAAALGETYGRVYYWTASGRGPRRARAAFPPAYGWARRKGEPEWFAPEQVEQLREWFAVLDRVQEVTGDRRASKARRAADTTAPRGDRKTSGRRVVPVAERVTEQ
jgi:hypothetical protein